MEFRKPVMRSLMMMSLPVLAGAAAGYAYYYYIGCVSGTCPITSNPWISTAYGGVLGGIWVPWGKYIGKKQESEG